MIITFAVEGDETQVLSFDSVLNFSEKLSGKVAEYETEFGFPINDNIVLSNPKFSVSGVLSTYVDDDNLIQYDGFDFYTDGEGDLPTITDLENRVRDIYNGKKSFDIYRSQDKNNPFSTTERVIPNCIISDLTFTYDSEKYGAVYPQMEITQLNLVSVLEVDNTNASPQLIPSTSVASAGSTSKGSKSGDGDSIADPTAKIPAQKYGSDGTAYKQTTEDKASIARDLSERTQAERENEALRRTIALQESGKTNQRVVYQNGSYVTYQDNR